MKSELLPLCISCWTATSGRAIQSHWENWETRSSCNGTWDESNIRPGSEILAMAQSSGNKIHIGFLMARIVFWGDAVKDEENQAAVFDDIAAFAPTSLAGLSLIVAYGLLDGNETSTSDCIKAYVQSLLSSSHPTYVLLPSSWFQIMLSISISLALRSSNHCTVIHWPVRLGRIISPKSLPKN